MSDLDFRAEWNAAYRWDDYLANEVKENRPLWEGVYRKTWVPQWAIERAGEPGGEWKLLVLAEDWCGDAANSVPVLARLAEAVPNWEMRVAKRDKRPDLMDRYLTNGSRSIPIAAVLDSAWEPVARWGPRPEALQQRVLEQKRAGDLSLEEIYRDARAWYARDAGESTLRELFEQVEARRASAG